MKFIFLVTLTLTYFKSLWYFGEKISSLASEFKEMLKTTMNFVHFWTKVHTRVKTSGYTIADNIWACFPERVAQYWFLDFGLLNHKLIYRSSKISSIKRRSHKQVKFHSLNYYTVDFFEHEWSKLINLIIVIKTITRLMRYIMTLFRKIMKVIDKAAHMKEKWIKQSSREWLDWKIADEIRNYDNQNYALIKLFTMGQDVK